jgi:hypothetical protein
LDPICPEDFKVFCIALLCGDELTSLFFTSNLTIVKSMSSPSQVIEFFKWTETQLIKLHPQLQLVVNKKNYTIKLSSSVQQMIVIPKAAISKYFLCM